MQLGCKKKLIHTELGWVDVFDICCLEDCKEIARWLSYGCYRDRLWEGEEEWTL